MKSALHFASSLLMSFAAFLLRALGGWDAALGLMFLLMALDVLSGVIVAGMRRSGRTVGGGFLSSAFFLGLTRKLLMVLLVILGTALDGLLGTQICRVSIIGFYAANEAFSVIENAAVMGVPFPKGVLLILERYRDRMDQSGVPAVQDEATRRSNEARSLSTEPCEREQATMLK